MCYSKTLNLEFNAFRNYFLPAIDVLQKTLQCVLFIHLQGVDKKVAIIENMVNVVTY